MVCQAKGEDDLQFCRAVRCAQLVIGTKMDIFQLGDAPLFMAVGLLWMLFHTILLLVSLEDAARLSSFISFIIVVVIIAGIWVAFFSRFQR